ncbi:MAG: APC family permease [Pirellulales bacterium]|nr:APC family permease [Pirellulales bacterium]
MTSRDDSDRRDNLELAHFGYRQQLARTMGGFSSFAVSFSLISITTGIFTNFGHGLRHAGPAVIWSWTVAVIGQFLVALVVAELANHMPLSGYGYQWASRLVGPGYGFFVGWLLLLQWLTGFPGICYGLARELHSFVSGYLASPSDMPVGPAGLTAVVIAAIAVVHLFGIRLAALVNDLGVLAEIAGAVLIVVVLLGIWLIAGGQHSNFLFDSTSYTTAAPANWHGWALSLLLGAWCITGFEGAADLAEETHRPRATVPRAVIMSELSSGIGGFLMLAAFLLSIEGLRETQASASPLLLIIQAKLGDRFTPLVMFVVFVSIFACGVASMAAATRLVFALARDNMLPGSRVLKRVEAVHGAPRAAILLVWLLSTGIVLALERSGVLMFITSIATLAGYLGYGGIVLAAILGLTSRQDASPVAALNEAGVAATSQRGFKLGRWRGPVCWGALVWTVLLVIAVSLPIHDDQPTTNASASPSGLLDQLRPYAPLCATSASIGAGVLLFVMLVRPRLRAGTAGPPNDVSDDRTTNMAASPLEIIETPRRIT